MNNSNGFWICPNCGQQVWSNVYHYCTPAGNYFGQPGSFTIEAKLDKIIELLEKLLNK